MKFKPSLILILAFGFYSLAFSQDKKNVEDAFNELENNELTLRFANALDGNPVENAIVKIEKSGEYRTDFNGLVHFPIPQEDGIYKVEFSHDRYVKAKFNIEIMAGSLFFNRFSVSPKMPAGTIRFVLDWGDKPKDLDIHLVKDNDYHISFRNLVVTSDGIAKLDRDAKDGYGPETITVAKINPSAEYLLYVRDYSDQGDIFSRNLSDSKASIKVYGGDNELLAMYKVPDEKEGNNWNVLKIINGQLVKINEIKK